MAVFSDTEPEDFYQYTPKHRKGWLSKLMRIAIPAQVPVEFVYSRQAHRLVSQSKYRKRYLLIVAVVLVIVTITIATQLLRIPYLNVSVLSLCTALFENFTPTTLATFMAVGTGIGIAVLAGGFTSHSSVQDMFDSLPATRVLPYNVFLRFALWEELSFRAGSEKWSWPQRIRVTALFGVMHIVNFWVPFGVAIALMLTGFGFLLVYLYVHWRSGGDQALATSVAAVVHAMYNLIVIGIGAILFVISGVVTLANAFFDLW